MSEDVKQVGTQFASDYLTSVQNNAVNNLTEGDDDTAGGGGAADITKINDPSLASQIRLMDIQNTQQQLNLENAAELDRMQREFYTGQDIRKMQEEGTQNRLGQMLGGEEQRKSARLAGQEQRAGIEEEYTQRRALRRAEGEEDRAGQEEAGFQQRSSARVAGEEQRAGIETEGTQKRASARVAGEEQRAGIETTGAQNRASRRVEGEEVRETDLQREMFRRYKESRDYGQAQSAYKA